METFLANLFSGRRRAFLKGREYLVVPARMIVPGILAGSNGPLYYPPDEISKDVGVWNGIPITAWHPTRNGQHVSARSPGIFETQGLGYVYETSYAGNLDSEAWFDIEATRNFDQRMKELGVDTNIFNRLDRGEPIELSTGLYTSNVPAPDNYLDHTGKPYSGMIARNYKPDHLAVLPDQKGACSLVDGCGINVNTKAQPVTMLPVSAAMAEELELLYNANPEGHNQYGEDEEEEDDAEAGELAQGDKKKKPKDVTPDKGSAKAGSAEAATRVEQQRQAAVKNAVPNQIRSEVTGYFKPYGAGKGKGEQHEAAQAGFVMLTDRQKELGSSAKLQADEGHNPASWVEDEGKWEKAKAAADKGNYDGDTYWAVVSHIYQQMGGAVKESESTNNNTPSLQESEEMTRQQKIAALCTNCSCWKGKEAVLGNAQAFSDADIDALLANASKAKTNEATVNALAEKLGKPYQNKKGKALVVNADFVNNEMMEVVPVDDEEEEGDVPAKGKQPPAPTGNKATKPMTSEEWLIANNAPPDIVQAIRNSEEETTRAKVAVVNKLIANLSDDAERDQVGNDLMKKHTLNELRGLLKLLPKSQPQQPALNQQPQGRYYFGLGGGAPGITGNDNDGADDDVALMTPPVANFKVWAEEDRKTRAS